MDVSRFLAKDSPFHLLLFESLASPSRVRVESESSRVLKVDSRLDSTVSLHNTNIKSNNKNSIYEKLHLMSI